MKIPQNPVDLRQYHQSITDALGDTGVPIYLDTSFLMWMLQTGDGVRKELLDWLTDKGDRVVIPTWTVHELYKHIKHETVWKEVQGRLDEYTSGLGQALIELAVSADDTLCERTPFNDRSHLLQSLRSDFVRLQRRLAGVLDKNKLLAQYQRALDEVIAFVNLHVATTNPFASFAEISASKDLRFSSKVPPGFKDEGKGENNCGDLIFWQEVLADLDRRKPCPRALIISHDNKSDWHYKPKALLNYRGERKPVKPELGLEARLPHPLLEHEASCKADVERLVIIDASILGLVLSKMDSAAARMLVAATHPPLIDREEEGVNWNLIDPQTAAQAATAVPATVTPAVTPPQTTAVTTEAAAPPTAQMSIRDLEAPPGEYGELLARLEGDFASRAAAVDEVFAPAFLGQRTPDELLLLGRRIYRSAALNGAPADIRLAELLQTARPLPATHRSALALGMFAELYFDRDANVRPVPLDGPWQPLFDLQYDEEFKEAIEQIAELLSPHAGKLLMVPSITPVAISIELQLVRPPERGRARRIESVIVGGKELLSDVVAGSSSSLSSLLGDPPSTVAALVRAVSQRFVIPLRQLEPNKEDQALSWEEDTGLRILRLDQGGVVDELSLAFQEEES